MSGTAETWQFANLENAQAEIDRLRNENARLLELHNMALRTEHREIERLRAEIERLRNEGA